MTAEGETCTKDLITEARRNIIIAQEQSYKDLLSNIPPKQKVVLQAIAKEGTAKTITSSKFIKKYHAFAVLIGCSIDQRRSLVL